MLILEDKPSENAGHWVYYYGMYCQSLSRSSIRIRVGVLTIVWAGVMGLLACPVWAWGTKEHILLTRLAVIRILQDPTAPEELKTFLRSVMPDAGDLQAQRDYFMTARLGAEPKGLSGLEFWVVEPDIRANRDRTTKIEPFGVPERLLHFVDLEYLHSDVDRQTYRHDLSNRLDLSDVPTDFTDPRFQKAGLLPFAVQRSYEQLVRSFREKWLTPDPTRPENSDHALRWLGHLAHYAQDNTQPHHSTADYKSASYFADKRLAPNVHSEMEWRMNDDEKESFPQLRSRYWDALIQALQQMPQDPFEKENDVWKETLLVADASYTCLPLIGLAAMSASGQKGTPMRPVGPSGPIDTEAFFRFEGPVGNDIMSVLDMKARQQALAVVRTSRLILRAWSQANLPPSTTISQESSPRV